MFLCNLFFVYWFKFVLDMDNGDYKFIHGVVDELWINVQKIISQKCLDGKIINDITRCNVGTIFRLFKVR